MPSEKWSRFNLGSDGLSECTNKYNVFNQIRPLNPPLFVITNMSIFREAYGTLPPLMHDPTPLEETTTVRQIKR